MKRRSLSDLALHQHCDLDEIPDLRLRRNSSSKLRKMLEGNKQEICPMQRPFVAGLLHTHMYQISAALVQPVAPLVVEPPSSSEEEGVPSPILVAPVDDHLLNLVGSINGNIKTSPVYTLQDEPDRKSVEQDVQPTEPSPSHAFSKGDRHAIKQLSTSTPAMTHPTTSSRGPADPRLVSPHAGGRSSADTAESSGRPKSPPSPQLIHVSTTSKAGQKKFHRHFKQVANEEKVLNYYSCALVGDILLQGHLYITKNYFAFYSNVFGYVTKLLIPTAHVLKVSKEKTVKIIPNAVGICTEDEKHVFGSLLSRDATYKLMVQVWKAATDPVHELKAPVTLKHDVEDSASGEMLIDDESSASVSANEETEGPPPPLPVVTGPETFQKLIPKVRKGAPITIPLSSRKSSKEYWSLRTSTSMLAISTALLVSLFLSAAFLLYRVSQIQDHFSDFPFSSNSEDIYEEILKWQSTLHARSAHEVHEFVNANLNQIAKVRHSLEALSMLILTNAKPFDGTAEEVEKSKSEDRIVS